MNNAPSGPLAGVRIVEVSTILAGPIACQILGDFGAEVIKVEHPVGGDPLRTHGPEKDGEALWWKVVGRNKRSVGLYLGDPEAAEIFLRIVATADVLVENFRPGTLDRYGLSRERLKRANPNLITLRVTGYGQTGPYRDRPGFGTLIEAMSGFAHLTGFTDGPPTLAPFGLADAIAGIAGASAVAMALYQRERDDSEGQEIDLSILETMLATLGPQEVLYDQLGHVERRSGNRSPYTAPRNLYECADGNWVAVSASTEAVAARLMTLVGHPEVVSEPWFSSANGRRENADALDQYVAAWIGERSEDEVVREFSAAEAAVAPVYDIARLMDDPQVAAKDAFVEAMDAVLGPVRMRNVLFGMEATPGSVRFPGRQLGEDTESILVQELGVCPETLEALRSRRSAR